MNNNKKGHEELEESASCEDVEVHQGAVEKALAAAPSEETLYDLAEFFKIFGDSTRIKILGVLFEGEFCVCDIAAILNMTQSAISHQLRLLRQNGIVRFRRAGKTVYYTMADDHIQTIYNQGLAHITE